MTAHENSRSRPGGAESSFFLYCLVKKWHVGDPIMIFTKKQEVYFLALKCKTTLVPAKLAGTCAKFKKYLWRLSQRNESWYVYPMVHGLEHALVCLLLTLPFFIGIDNSRISIGGIPTGSLPRKNPSIFSIREAVSVSVAGSVLWYYSILISLRRRHLSGISRSKLLVLNL
jgi:hypothetical protein